MASKSKATEEKEKPATGVSILTLNQAGLAAKKVDNFGLWSNVFLNNWFFIWVIPVLAKAGRADVG